MAQETDLRPLTPSFGDIISTWWRPFGFALRIGVKVAPFAFPMWLLWDGEIFSAATKGATESSTVMTEGMTGMVELMPVVMIVLVASILIMMPRRF